MTTRRTRTALAALALACWLALAVVPAQAEVLHEYLGRFNGHEALDSEGAVVAGGEAPEGPFQFVLTIAADTSSKASRGDVWVGDINGSLESSLYKFDADGAYAGVHITGATTPQGSLSLYSGLFRTSSIAVDPTDGDLYVANAGTGVIDRFSEAGVFLCQITARPPAARSAGEEEHECDGAKGSEVQTTPATESIEPTGIAVSASGTVYVADAGDDVIDEFSASGEYTGQLADPHIMSPGSIALDGSDLYVANGFLLRNAAGDVVKFHNGSFARVLAARSEVPWGVAVDPTSDHPYVARQNNEGLGILSEYDLGGSLLSNFASAQLPEPAAGIGVAATGRLYAANSGLRGGGAAVNIFSAPLALSVGAVQIGSGVAQLSATVVPVDGQEVQECKFEYGTTSEYGQSVPCEPSGPFTTRTEVTAAANGIAAGATYHFRFVLKTAEATYSGADHVFGPPQVEGVWARAGTTSATIHAQVATRDMESSCEVQYVAEPAFTATAYEGARSAPCGKPLTASFSGGSGIARLPDLAIDTVYHYRVIVANGAGSTVGEDHTFVTFGIESFSFAALDRAEEPFTQAGGHPYELRDAFALNTSQAEYHPGGNPPEIDAGLDANPKDVVTGLPSGLIGNPDAVPKCSGHDFTKFNCSGVSQVGVLRFTNSGNFTREAPLFNLNPPKGLAAQFGAEVFSFATVHIDARVRAGGDYGVTAEVSNISTQGPVVSSEVILWGVPADPAHDPERYCGRAGTAYERPCSERGPLLPFLTNPTACTGSLTAAMSVDPWQEPGNFVSALAPIPTMTGCDRLPFDPTISVQPQSRVSESPTGLHVDLHVPQNQNPDGLAEANLKDTTLRLPAGVAVNPSGANGLAACTTAQIGYKAGTSAPAEFTPDPAKCPAASKIGDIEVHTPLLDHPVKGGVYVAAPHDNPFGSLLAIYVAAHDPQSGVVLKLAGKVTPDPRTGQLTATFDDNPQLPFEDFELDLFGGSGASLMTPPTCGEYTTTTDMRPWSENGDQHPSDSFPIDGGANGGPCASTPGGLPNRQSLSAGTINPAAGAETPFVLNLSREDGTQRLSRIDTVLPPGLVGKLAGHPYCPEAALTSAAGRAGKAELASPSCPAASRVGSVKVAAGAGPRPYFVDGTVYLAGPYKGAPLSLAVITPAVAGPFDLGTVVVRVALRVDPMTAQITAISDPLPQILEGIPLDVRSILLRTDITRNPTNCEPMAVTATAFSALGGASPLSSRFQVGECAALSFRPRLKLRLKGATGRTGHPALKAVVTARPGEANIGRAQVNLPHGEFLDQANIDKACTRPVLLAGNCPRSSVYGYARAWTPLLAKPLQGPVYLVGGYGYKLPALVAELNGQIRILLVGKVDSGRNKGIRNTFEVVPDAPVSRFVLRMKGGRKYGLLENSEDLCRASRAKRRAIVRFTGHNGKVDAYKPVVTNQCGKKGKKRHAKHNHGRNKG